MTDHKLSWTGDGLVIKRYRQNAGDLPEREWRALRLLHRYAPGLAPEPVAVELDATPPSVTMRALPGAPLGDHPLSLPELRAIADSMNRMHTCVPEDVLAAVPVRFHALPEALSDVAEGLSAQPSPSQDPVAAQAYDEAALWLSGPDAGRLRSEEPADAVLGRSDHNLTNFLWDEGRVRLVDFEYAGRSDLCSELAELVEHISARCTADSAWQALFEELELTPGQRRRLLTARRLLAAMWFLMLLPGGAAERRNPPGTLGRQAERVLNLLNA